MALREDLIAAKALIEDPKDWCKGITEGQNCALWAVAAITNPHGRMYAPRWEAAAYALFKEVSRKYHNFGGHPVVFYNDDPATTHADIMALFDRAIASAGKAA